MKTEAWTRQTNLKRSKRLHGEELGGPQLKVEAETVEESPGQHRLAGSQPHDGDPVGAQGGNQLLQHVIMFPTQVIVHIPADNEENISTTKRWRTFFSVSFFFHLLAQPVVDPSVKEAAKGEADLYRFTI